MQIKVHYNYYIIIKIYLTHFCILILSYRYCHYLYVIIIRITVQCFWRKNTIKRKHENFYRSAVDIIIIVVVVVLLPLYAETARPTTPCTDLPSETGDCPPECLLHSAALATNGRTTPSACLNVECILCSE